MVETIDILGVPHTYELTPPTNCPDALVFIHGWMLSRGYWQPIIKQLSSRYQCLSYDLRGFGHSQLKQSGDSQTSAKSSSNAAMVARGQSLSDITVGQSTTVMATPPSRYRPAAYADDLILLLQGLNISRAWLIGHSLGGSIALWAADRRPDLVQGVICINSGGGIYLKEEFERFRAAGQQLVKLRHWLSYIPLVDLMMTRMSVARPLERSWGRQRLMDLVMANPEAALGTLLDSTTEAEVHYLPRVIARLSQPVYFIAGAEDTVMEPQYVRHLASFHRLFQSCGHNVTEIPNCGHMSMVEQPDEVASQIERILTQASKRN